VLFFCSCYIHCISNLLPLIYYLYMLQYLQYIVVATSCTIPPSNLLTSFLSFFCSAFTSCVLSDFWWLHTTYLQSQTYT